jgi:pimeloyl-ACP methyl ester carboxylesterase
MAVSSSIENFAVQIGDASITGLWTKGAEFDHLPVVLIHGIGSAAESWRPLLEMLGRKRRVLAWNAPGYGRSTPLTTQNPNANDYAACLIRFLNSIEISRCHLVGHSLGAIVAARAMSMWPNDLASLTLASIALGHARLSPERRAMLRTSRLDDLTTLGPRGMAEKRGPRLLGPDAPPEAIQAVINVMATINPDGYTAASNMLAQADILTDLATATRVLPVKIIYGDADVITPPAANLQAASIMPWSSVTSIERGGHAVYVEKTTEFFLALDTFLCDLP